MNGWLLWVLFLPILLVIAGVITIRRRNGRLTDVDVPVE
jgi:hypothetical protein